MATIRKIVDTMSEQHDNIFDSDSGLDTLSNYSASSDLYNDFTDFDDIINQDIDKSPFDANSAQISAQAALNDIDYTSDSKSHKPFHIASSEKTLINPGISSSVLKNDETPPNHITQASSATNKSSPTNQLKSEKTSAGFSLKENQDGSKSENIKLSTFSEVSDKRGGSSDPNMHFSKTPSLSLNSRNKSLTNISVNAEFEHSAALESVDSGKSTSDSESSTLCSNNDKDQSILNLAKAPAQHDATCNQEQIQPLSTSNAEQQTKFSSKQSTASPNTTDSNSSNEACDSNQSELVTDIKFRSIIDTKEETEAQRVFALEQLSIIEIEFAKLRENLYLEKRGHLYFEEELLKREAHPKYLTKIKKLQDSKDDNLEVLRLTYSYRKTNLLRQTEQLKTTAIRSYLSKKQNLMKQLLDDLNRKLFTAKDSFAKFVTGSGSFDEPQVDYSAPTPIDNLYRSKLKTGNHAQVSGLGAKPASKRKRSNDAALAKKHVNIPTKLLKAATTLAGATPDEMEADLLAIGVHYIRKQNSSKSALSSSKPSRKKAESHSLIQSGDFNLTAASGFCDNPPPPLPTITSHAPRKYKTQKSASKKSIAKPSNPGLIVPHYFDGNMNGTALPTEQVYHPNNTHQNIGKSINDSINNDSMAGIPIHPTNSYTDTNPSTQQYQPMKNDEATNRAINPSNPYYHYPQPMPVDPYFDMMRKNNNYNSMASHGHNNSSNNKSGNSNNPPLKSINTDVSNMPYPAYPSNLMLKNIYVDKNHLHMIAPLNPLSHYNPNPNQMVNINPSASVSSASNNSINVDSNPGSNGSGTTNTNININTNSNAKGNGIGNANEGKLSGAHSYNNHIMTQNGHMNMPPTYYSENVQMYNPQPPPLPPKKIQKSKASAREKIKQKPIKISAAASSKIPGSMVNGAAITTTNMSEPGYAASSIADASFETAVEPKPESKTISVSGLGKVPLSAASSMSVIKPNKPTSKTSSSQKSSKIRNDSRYQQKIALAQEIMPVLPKSNPKEPKKLAKSLNSEVSSFQPIMQSPATMNLPVEIAPYPGGTGLRVGNGSRAGGGADGAIRNSVGNSKAEASVSSYPSTGGRRYEPLKIKFKEVDVKPTLKSTSSSSVNSSSKNKAENQSLAAAIASHPNNKQPYRSRKDATTVTSNNSLVAISQPDVSKDASSVIEGNASSSFPTAADNNAAVPIAFTVSAFTPNAPKSLTKFSESPSATRDPVSPSAPKIVPLLAPTPILAPASGLPPVPTLVSAPKETIAPVFSPSIKPTPPPSSVTASVVSASTPAATPLAVPQSKS